MRFSSWDFHCPLICSSKSSINHCSPQPLRLDGAQNVPSSPSAVPVVVEEKVGGEKTGVEESKLDDGKVGVVLKSSLKKPVGDRDCGEAGKGRVKWMDFVGKELVEIREFETNDSWDSDDNSDINPACMCVIQ